MDAGGVEDQYNDAKARGAINHMATDPLPQLVPGHFSMESSSLWAAVDCAMQILANADPLEGLYNRLNRLKNVGMTLNTLHLISCLPQALDNIEELEGLASLTDQDEKQALKTKKLLITEEINL